MSVIPAIPPQKDLAELITAVNDRLRKIDGQLSKTASATAVSATFLAAPQPAASDKGLIWVVSDFAHVLIWDGGGWNFADAQGGYIAGRAFAPGKYGWQLCDGSATTYLQVDDNGTVRQVSFTTPNLTGTAAYPKWASAYTGSIVAGTSPTTTSGSADTGGGGGSGSFLTAITAPGEPTHLNVLPYFRR